MNKRIVVVLLFLGLAVTLSFLMADAVESGVFKSPQLNHYQYLPFVSCDACPTPLPTNRPTPTSEPPSPTPTNRPTPTPIRTPNGSPH